MLGMTPVNVCTKTARNGGVLIDVILLDCDSVSRKVRMLGGVRITETTRKHAAEMLGKKS